MWGGDDMRWRRTRFARLWQRRNPQLPKGKHALLWGSLLGLGGALALIVWMEVQLRPVIQAIATTQISNVVADMVNHAVSDYVSEGEFQYEDFITLERGAEGQITALTSNMANLNHLRSTILAQVVADVSALYLERVNLPLGNLTGINLFSGLGLPIPLEIASVGSATAELSHAFTAAGINQTHHQILLHISVALVIVMPGGNAPTQVSAQIPVAETILVGEVPDTYMEWGAP